MKTATLILVIITLIALITVVNDALYCFIFEHKDWKKWKEILKLLPSSSLVKHTIFEGEHSYLNSYVFHIPIVDSIGCPVNIYYWENKNIVSVHLEDGKCYLSDFDTYHVNKAIEIIKQLSEHGNKYINADKLKKLSYEI